MRVLVVDDDRVFRTELSALLEDEGHETLGVGSADEALAVLDRRPFDVLLTDLRMPRRSGTGLLDDVRRSWPGLRTIVLTGQSTEETIATSLDHGAFNFISKPVRVQEVLRVLFLVAQDIEFSRRLAPEWNPSALPPGLASRGLEDALGWGPPLPGVPPWKAISLDGDARSSAPRDFDPVPGDGGHGPVILHLGGRSDALAPGTDLLHVVESGASLAGEARPLAVVVDERAASSPALLALWWTLARGPVPDGLSGVSGPQRREILKRLRDRPLELAGVASPYTRPEETLRVRFCLEHLIRSGLARQQMGLYGLTAVGEAVVALLEAVKSADGTLPHGRYLFLNPAP